MGHEGLKGLEPEDLFGSQPIPIDPSGLFEPGTPFTPGAPFNGVAFNPAGTVLPGGQPSEGTQAAGPEVTYSNGSTSAHQPPPPTGSPVASQPPPPTSLPSAVQPPAPPTNQVTAPAQVPPTSAKVSVPPPPPSGGIVSQLPPTPTGAAGSNLPPAPAGATVRMPPQPPLEPAQRVEVEVHAATQPVAAAGHAATQPVAAAGHAATQPVAPIRPAVPVGVEQAVAPVTSSSPIAGTPPTRFAAPAADAVPSAVASLTGAQQAARLDDAIELGQALVANLRHVVLGTPGALTAVAVAALSGGHLLIEDVPGVGKTVLAQALAASLGTDLSRLQGHPDLLPSDVTGVSVFSPDTGTWEFKPGPVFAHVVLVDELNRTPPRTQAALLETMEEQQVSADGESWSLPVPHLVIATQNPHSQLGTYPLVESQLDRFALATAIGYPDADVETQIVLQHGGRPALSDLRPVCTPEQWHAAQLATQTVVVEESVAAYAVALCRGSRSVAGVRLGASPRAAIWLVRTAQAHAILAGRAYVTPGDIKAMALSCLSHRLTTDEGVAFGVKVVRELLESTPAPRP